eukprot:m.115658 g.115658  ORF g.115658 m.115658 type:complete len:521 (+) comp37557_c0_seq4:30-1592(+)
MVSLLRQKARRNRHYDPVRVSVVSLSGQEEDGVGCGVGKSCLCSQFVRPQHDDYERSKGRHSSCISAADAASPQILNGHFLYHGQASRTSVDGSVEVKVDVVEQTEFYDSDRCCRFMFGNRPYVERALLRSLEARGKTTYIDMDAVGTDAGGESAVPFPQAFGKKGVQGFLCLYDPTLVTDHPLIGKRQNQLVQQLIWHSQNRLKLPIVMAVTKCDTISSADFDQHSGIKEARHLAATAAKKLPLIFCSAQKNVNVDSAFLCLANMILKGKLDGCLPDVEEYIEAAVTKEEETKMAEDEFRRLLNAKVDKEEITWRFLEPKIARKEEYKRLVALCGRDAALQMFKMRIIRLVWLASQSTAVAFSSKSADVRREKAEQIKREILSRHEDFRNEIDGSLINMQCDDYTYGVIPKVHGADRYPCFNTLPRPPGGEDDDERRDLIGAGYHSQKSRKGVTGNLEHPYTAVPVVMENEYAEVPENEYADVSETDSLSNADDSDDNSLDDYLPMEDYINGKLLKPET